VARKGKNNRRYSAPRSTKYTRGAAPRPAPSSSAATAKPASEEPTPKASGEVDFRSEYRYVLSDLKRIGILAAAMFGVLVGLAVVLP
jgi:hypothetical protein